MVNRPHELSQGHPAQLTWGPVSLLACPLGPVCGGPLPLAEEVDQEGGNPHLAIEQLLGLVLCGTSTRLCSPDGGRHFVVGGSVWPTRKSRAFLAVYDPACRKPAARASRAESQRAENPDVQVVRRLASMA
jgi:hypothetical protein